MELRAEQALAERRTEENPRSVLSATGSAGLASLVRGSSRRITTMGPRPANIRVINRRNRRLGPRLLGSDGRRLRWRKGQARFARRCATLDPILAGGRRAVIGGLAPSANRTGDARGKT